MPIYKMSGKKDGKTKYRVRINYQDNTGKYRQIDRVTYGNEEAKNLERELLYNIKNETKNTNLTLRQLYDEYINAKKYEVRESSLDKTKRILEYHVLPMLQEIKVRKLTIPVLQKWKLTMEKKKTDSGNPLAVTTKMNVFGEFCTLLNYAIKMDYISQNPLSKIGNFKDTSTIKKEMDFYTAEEFKKFAEAAIDYAKESEANHNLKEWHFYVFFCIAFYTGLRKGEIHGLQWNDISGEYLSVKRSIAQKLKGSDRITPPKNKTSLRTIQIPEPLKKILDTHYDRCKRIDKFNDTIKICGGEKPLRDTSIEIRNSKYAQAAGIKKIRIHDFRHSHASLLANNGINIQEIARRLGHSKIEITWNTYSHLYPREEEKAVEILNKIV